MRSTLADICYKPKNSQARVERLQDFLVTCTIKS
jgi:hypothetical protein